MTQEQYDGIIKTMDVLREASRYECGSYIQELIDDAYRLIVRAMREEQEGRA